MAPPLKAHLAPEVPHDANGIPYDSTIRSDGKRALAVDTGAAGGGGGTVQITENQQVQNVETTAALAGSGTFTSTARDYLNFEGDGVSVFIQRSAADTNVDVFIENSSDGGVTFRNVETLNLAVTAAAPTATLNRIYGVTRRHNRVRLVNNTANALLATELVTMQKPIS